MLPTQFFQLALHPMPQKTGCLTVLTTLLKRLWTQFLPLQESHKQVHLAQLSWTEGWKHKKIYIFNKESCNICTQITSSYYWARTQVVCWVQGMNHSLLLLRCWKTTLCLHSSFFIVTEIHCNCICKCG